MTALDLSTASRALLPDADPVTAANPRAFGPATLAPPSGTQVAVETAEGWYAWPRDTDDPSGSAPLLQIGSVSNPWAPADNWAYMVAFDQHDGKGTTVDPIIYTGFWAYMIGSATEIVSARADGGSGTQLVSGAGTLPTAPTDAPVVFFVVGNSTEAFYGTSLDGVLGTGPAISSIPASGGVDLYSDAYGGDGPRLMGMWLWEGATVSQADAADTAAAIATMLSNPAPTGPAGFSVNGPWNTGGSADFTALAEGETPFDPPAIPAPPKGGTKVRPAAPTPLTPSEMKAAGVYPIRHVWEQMPEPTEFNAMGFPVNWEPTASGNTEYGYLQIVSQGTDITLLSGMETPFPTWRRAQPFGCQSTTIELPQISTFHARPSWAGFGANVEVNLVKIGGPTVTLAEGVVVAAGVNEDSGLFTLDCTGDLLAADFTMWDPFKTQPPSDIGSLIPKLLNSVTSRRWLTMLPVVTGIRSGAVGDWSPTLVGIQQVLSTALDKSGRQWTVAYRDRTPVLERKDMTTVAATVRAGQRGIKVRLKEDASQAPNVIKASWITEDGGLSRNVKYPNWNPDDTPAFPNTSPVRSMRQGDTDADTDSGTGVSTLEKKLGVKVDGVLSASDIAAVKRAQDRLGITPDGVPGPQTWAAVFDTGANTGSLDGAFVMPVAAAPGVTQYLYGPDGDIVGDNPAYDEDIVVVERFINLGRTYTKDEVVTYAENLLVRDSVPGLVGTIEFEIDPPEKSRLELFEGENILTQGIQGDDVKLHIAQISHSARSSVATVDSKARDYPEIQAIRRRNAEAIDPAKAALKRITTGRTVTDRATYDADSPAGDLPKHAIFGGTYWDVRRIPMGDYGDIAHVDARTTNPVQKFAMAIFGKKITANKLYSIVGNPLAVNDPWSEHKEELVEDYAMIEAWGHQGQPMGYWPNTYSRPDGDGGVPVTGRLVDSGGFPFASETPPWVYVAMIAPSPGEFQANFKVAASV